MRSANGENLKDSESKAFSRRGKLFLLPEREEEKRGMCETDKEKGRIGVAAIIIEDMESVREINEALHSFSDLIVGRLGIPYRERGVSVISVILDGDPDKISALTGKLGKIKSVTVKAVMSKK